MAILPVLNLLRLPRRILSSHVQKLPCAIKNDFSRNCSTKQSSKVLEHLSSRSLIKIAGTDASDFLQGLITNDMRHFDDGAANIYTLFLNTKGRVMCESIIYNTLEKSTYYIECDTRMINDLQKHLKMYKIRRKVDIESLENTMKVWTTFEANFRIDNDGDDCEFTKRRLEGQIFPCGTLSNKSTKLVDNMMIYEDPRIPEMNLRILSNDDVARDEIVKNLGFDVATAKNLPTYREFRYRLGIGEGIDDLPIGKAFPLEINCDYLHGVSFHKGCYIGQELTARTHHTGVVRKRLMPITLENCSKENFNYDENIVNESGKVVGKFRGKEGVFGIGLMRITEALNAQTMKISDSRVTVTKPQWWPKEAQKDKAADTGK